MTKRHQESEGKPAVSGRNAVRELLEKSSGTVAKIFLARGASPKFVRDLRQLARSEGVPVQEVPVHRLERLVPGVNHQGVAAVQTAFPYSDVHDLLTAAGATPDEVRGQKPIILLLDNIQDPHNLGAIIRSGVAAGVAGIIIPSRNAAPLNAAAMKTSAGAASRIPVARVQNIVTTLDQMKERGYWIAGADGKGETSMWAMDWDRPLGLVIGNEEKGMRPAVSAMCDYRVSIPIVGDVESLNASVATGVMLYAVLTGRRQTPDTTRS